VIREGRVLCHGTPEQVVAHPEARKHYFGDEMDLGRPHVPPPHFPAPRRGEPTVKPPAGSSETPPAGP